MTLHAIYTVAPNHIVLAADSKPPNFSRVHAVPFSWPREMGHPRGGASPYLHRNEWYHFVHCVMRWQGQRWYSINLYTFENAPPFRPARILPFPLLLPSVADRWNDSHPNVVFPAGVVRHGGYWQVSFGYQDKWTEIAEWDGDALELLLEPIPGGPYDVALRPGWHDRTVWRDVYTANAYELPERFSPDDTIVDVGAHVGSFSRACMDRGAGRVIACEPHFGTEWRANLGSYGDRARLVEQAIGSERARSCIQPFAGGFYGSTPTREYFGGSLPLSDVLEGLGPVRLLKLDCEGPEFSILAETDLGQVAEVIGEIHPHRGAGGEEFRYQGFLELLAAAGFTVSKAVRPGETGLFWARR